MSLEPRPIPVNESTGQPDNRTVDATDRESIVDDGVRLSLAFRRLESPLDRQAAIEFVEQLAAAAAGNQPDADAP